MSSRWPLYHGTLHGSWLHSCTRYSSLCLPPPPFWYTPPWHAVCHTPAAAGSRACAFSCSCSCSCSFSCYERRLASDAHQYEYSMSKVILGQTSWTPITQAQVPVVERLHEDQYYHSTRLSSRRTPSGMGVGSSCHSHCHR